TPSASVHCPSTPDWLRPRSGDGPPLAQPATIRRDESAAYAADLGSLIIRGLLKVTFPFAGFFAGLQAKANRSMESAMELLRNYHGLRDKLHPSIHSDRSAPAKRAFNWHSLYSSS